MKLYRFTFGLDTYLDAYLFVVAPDLKTARKEARRKHYEDGWPLPDKKVQVADAPGMLVVYQGLD